MEVTKINKRPPDGIKEDGKPIRVLVVDDSKFIAKQLAQILTSEMYEVCGTAEDGNEAVKKFMELSPDVTTLDITMPNLDGLGALDQIIKYNPKAKVVMVSALGKEDTVKDALTRGAVNFIVKPFNRNQVLERFRKVLGIE
ncbi:MAG: response regulator [Spirochaetia bacterium]|nr:response regulator [Spirochaetia bacterium]